MNEEEIFQVAAEMPAAERGAYLATACEGQPALRERLERLLASHDDGGFMQRSSDRHDSAELEAELARFKPEEGEDRIGHFKLLQQIGEGGFGTVWMAEQLEPVQRRVALKIIKPGMDTKEVIVRFEQERQALALMDHPNIAKVLDAGVTPLGRPFFVMELVRGIRITDFCDQNNLPPKERLALFIAVCQAIQHAHQKGIIHRDIKPSNILVTLQDGVLVPKVIDFGVAKAIQSQRLTELTFFTRFEQMIGTPLYMSPEQAEMSGLDVDTRSDIYSLGVLLYELLTGTTPLDAKELMALGIDAMRKAIREKEPVRPSTRLAQRLRRGGAIGVGSTGYQPLPSGDSPGGMRRAPQTNADGHCQETHPVVPVGGSPTGTGESPVPPISSRRLAQGKATINLLRGDLDWIVMKCLEKDRTRRYETASGLAGDVQRHLDNEPVIARPPSVAYRFQKFVRRNKLAFTAATAVAVALVAGIGFSTWQMFAARNAQRATEVARVHESIQRNLAEQERLEARSAEKVAETERQRADAQARKASESEHQSRRLLYASDMNLAQQSLKLNNLGKARRLLDRHRSQPGEEDLRGWEWRYLWQLTRSSALVTLTNRPTRGFSVSFSPDGTRLAVGWYNGSVDLWDVPGRRWVRALTDREHPHQGRVAFSPVRNLLAATSEPKVVALYDLDSDREMILWRAPDKGEWEVRDLQFSQDGSRLVIYVGTPSARIYGGSTIQLDDEVWVLNVSSSKIESHHPTVYSATRHHGAARLSPDNQRLYLARSDNLNYRYSIQCLDLATGQELWQTKRERDAGLTTLAISPDGRVLASGSGFEDPTIRIWDAATGRLLVRLDGHTGWVCKLAFTKDGRRLISAAADQSIRFWDTSNWTETQVLRGHTDEVHAVAISETAQLVASASKDGELMLWKEDGKSASGGYSRLSEDLEINQVLPLDHSRVLLLPAGKPPELVDLKHDSVPGSLPEIGSSADVLGWFGTNILCHWNGTNQVLVCELRGAEFVQRGAISLDSGTRPTGLAYNTTRQLLAWAEGTSSVSVYLESLAAPGRIELMSDAPGLVYLHFSEDGNYLAVWTKGGDSLRAWNVGTGKIVTSSGGRVRDARFAAGGRLLVVAIEPNKNHEIGFYDLASPDRPPRRVPGIHFSRSLAVSPDGRLVASSTGGGLVRLFDPAKGELIESVHGHLNAAFGVAFSPDGRRLISTSGAREAVKLWDVSTRQELLTLVGIGSALNAGRWSADGDVILAGAPWQAWRAPSWEEIAAAEAKPRDAVNP